MPHRLLLLAVALLATGCSLFRPKPPVYEAVRLDSGVVVRDLLVPEKGAPVAPGDTIAIRYELRLPDRTLVESSQDLGQPLRFEVGAGAVPIGLEQGVVGMRLFGSRVLTIPSALAFGAEGNPPRVPPNTDVVFEVELMEHEVAGG